MDRACVDQRDGCAVAVTDEDRLLDLERLQQRRQDHLRFVVHEPRAASSGKRGRLAVADSRVGEDRFVELPGEACREIPPRRHRAEAFMQQHNPQRLACVAVAARLEPMAGHVQRL